ncbi:neutral zinc metallopeptidase, partial [Acinetobacter baumannii]
GRRGGGGVKAGGISIIGLVVAFVAWKFFGVDPQMAYQATQQVTASQQSNATSPESLTPEQKEASDFVGTVLADTEDTWTPIFKQLGKTYTPPKLVLFSGMTRSGCGTAQS